MRILPAFVGAVLVSQAALAAAGEPPRLIVAISVDQFSSTLLERNRPSFSGGLKTLLEGGVFLNGYQSHASTETCPGHSTILSGIRPGHSGIIANDWYGDRAKVQRPSYKEDVYCVEDTTADMPDGERAVAFSNVSSDFKTLGDRMKDKFGAKSRVYAVAGKDRAATMMGGRKADQTWWYDPGKKGYTSFAKQGPQYGVVAKSAPQAVAKANGDIATLLTQGIRPELAAECQSSVRPVTVSGSYVVGSGAVNATNASDFRATVHMDAITLDIAKGLLSEFDLGAKGKRDVLAISLSATDYVGHAFGTAGPEMCMQLRALDKGVGDLLDTLKARGNPFTVVLTADHGGIDMPERGLPLPDGSVGKRSPLSLVLPALNSLVHSKLGNKAKPAPTYVTSKGLIGDVWLTDEVPDAQKEDVAMALKGVISGFDGVHAVYTRKEILATPMPTTSPDKWSQIEMVRVNYMDGRSGHLYVVLEEGLSPISIGGKGYVATHGSPWAYDRRVPILFWGQGVVAASHDNAVETVDILPTLASFAGVKVPASDVDGRCLDLDPGKGNTCR